jgi:prolyl-tRNA editing enzyme YbaK/EbsC (Cys-tRNA(Pro) deacylase)
MHPTAERFAAAARDRVDFDPDVTEFPEGTKTAADAAEAVDCAVSEIVKSIVMRVTAGNTDDAPGGWRVAAGDAVVVLTAGHHRVDPEALADALGVRSVSSADPETVKDATGWSIGGVPPFPHDDLPVYLDPSLLDHETVWAAAGTPQAVFPIAPDDLRRIADPEPVEAFTEA